MDFNVSVRYAGAMSGQPWDSIGVINLTQVAQDVSLHGCEFAYDRWWVSGIGTDGHHELHTFDRDGNETGSVHLASTNPSDWLDLAFDGRLLWGSQGHNIVGVDTLGNVVRTIAAPYQPNRAVTFDPASRHFFVADYTTDIVEIDSAGGVIQTIPNPGLTISGLAWNSTDSAG